MSFLYLLAYVVSDENSEIILIVVLYLMGLFSLNAFKYFSTLLIFSNLITMYSFPRVYPVWGSLSFLDQWVYIFPQIWKIFSQYFCKYFSSPISSFSC